MPWTHQWDFSVTWKPKYFDHRMTLDLSVLNAFNAQSPTSFASTAMAGNGGNPSVAYSVLNSYNVPLSYQTPRYVMFTLSYDY
jgi:hypothetical protein